MRPSQLSFEMTRYSDRFWLKVAKQPNGCWEWQGACLHGGTSYGVFGYQGKNVLAHRFAYEELKGAIPSGYELDHLCRNKRCVNPDHLEVVTRSENTKRGLLPGIMRLRHLNKTQCPKGHPYNEVNTYITPRGSRDCRICRREAKKRYRRRLAIDKRA